MGLPLLSLEIELGPSQVEAVFAPTDALRAADNMVRFRNGVRQALGRAGYWASFMCRPPFDHIMSSGWHLHQSLIDLESGANLFVRDAAAQGSSAQDAEHTLSPLGAHYLAGLLDHAAGALVFCTPTANGYGRFRPLALAPQAAVWGRDNRGAMLRVIGQAQDTATRIENRIGEPAATTVNVAGWPIDTETLAGWVVNAGNAPVGVTDSVKVWSKTGLTPLLARIVKLKGEPVSFVGVPVRAPVVELRDAHGGKVPAVTLNVGAGEPVAWKEKLPA
jgi:hypothetical protein